MRGGWRRVASRLALSSAAIIASAVLLGAAPATAQEDDGLRVESDTVYRVVPDEFAIEVEITYSVTNQVPNRRQGFTIIQTFFRSLTETLPADATDITATRSNGAALSVELSEFENPDLLDEEGEPVFLLWEIDFGPNLFYNQTRDFTLRYRIPDGAARDLDAWARINPAFVSFVALARGDHGLASVTVEIPESFDVDLFTDGARPSRSVVDGVQVWTAADIDDPFEWSVFFVGSDIGGLDRAEIELDGIGTFAIASWPGDDEWVTFVTDTIETGMPLLVEAVGQDWPHDDPTQIVETVVPSLAGYAGLYYELNPSLNGQPFPDADAVVEIGEDLNVEVLNHELAHAWFNTGFSDMRWLNEGLAEYFGHLVSERSGDERPERFPLPRRSHPDSFPLREWQFSRSNDPEEYGELYGYSASFHVMTSLASEMGDDGMIAAVDVLLDRTNPHAPELDRARPLDWRMALDVFEIVGGAESAEEVFVNWILGDGEETEELATRRATLDGRDDVAAHELGWEIPLAVPTLLGAWDFDEADELLAAMEFFLDGQVAALEYADAVGVELPDDVRPLFEGVDDPDDGLEAAEAVAAEQRAAMVDLQAAQIRLAQPRTFVERLGLRGEDPDAELAAALDAFEDGDYAGAVEQAAVAVDTLDGADDRGTDQLTEWILNAAGLLVVLAILFWLWRRRRRKKREAAADEATPENEDVDRESPEDDGGPDEDDEGAAEVE